MHLWAQKGLGGDPQAILVTMVRTYYNYHGYSGYHGYMGNPQPEAQLDGRTHTHTLMRLYASWKIGYRVQAGALDVPLRHNYQAPSECLSASRETGNRQQSKLSNSFSVFWRYLCTYVNVSDSLCKSGTLILASPILRWTWRKPTVLKVKVINVKPWIHNYANAINYF
jgi:hypothetical protein